MNNKDWLKFSGLLLLFLAVSVTLANRKKRTPVSPQKLPVQSGSSHEDKHMPDDRSQGINNSRMDSAPPLAANPSVSAYPPAVNKNVEMFMKSVGLKKAKGAIILPKDSLPKSIRDMVDQAKKNFDNNLKNKESARKMLADVAACIRQANDSFAPASPEHQGLDSSMRVQMAQMSVFMREDCLARGKQIVEKYPSLKAEYEFNVLKMSGLSGH